MKIPYAGLLSVFLIIFVEIFFLSYTNRFTGSPILEPTADDAVLSSKLSLSKKSGGTVVIIGDSSSMHGFVPRIIEDEIGHEVVNLGTLASFTTVGFVELSVNLLAKKEKPLAIVFAVLPQTLAIDRSQAEKYGILGRYAAAYGSRTGLYIADLYDYSNLFLRKHQFNIFPPDLGGSYGEFLKKIEADDGFLEEKKIYSSPSKKIGVTSPSPFAIESFEALSAEAQRNSVPVFFIFNPKPESAVGQVYAKKSLDNLKALTKIYQFDSVQSDIPVWPDRFFGTETHLNLEGAIKFSAHIGSMLKDKI